MTLNIVYLSPHFPPRFHYFAANLLKRGVRVLGITDQPTYQLHHDVRDSLYSHAQVGSLHDTEDVLREVDQLQHQFGTIHRIESHLETWLDLEAEVREAFDIPGLRPHQLGALKRKSLMKAAFQGAGVRVAESAQAANSRALKRLIRKVGFPLILKPDTGVGAQDVHKINSKNDLHAFLTRNDPGGYLAEEFIQGNIVTYDGLAGANGKVLFYTSHQYSADARRIVGEGLDFFYLNARSIPDDLAKAGRHIIEGLDIREKFFHLEFFRIPSGELVGIELNIRPPGGFTTDMFNYAHDIDVYDLWAGVVTGEIQDFAYERPYHCAHISRRRRYAYQRSHDEVVHSLGHRLCTFQELNPLYASAMGEWAYLVRSPDRKEIREMAELIQG
jgi:hypothetical protein